MRLNAIAMQLVDPVFERLFAPIPISAPDIHIAELGEHGEDGIDTLMRGIVRIDQQRDIGVIGIASIRHYDFLLQPVRTVRACSKVLAIVSSGSRPNRLTVIATIPHTAKPGTIS